MTGLSSSPCMMFSTVNNSLHPKDPPGWNTAKFSGVNWCWSNKHTANASPNANAAVVLVVGANPHGQASFSTSTNNVTSEFLPKVEL